MTDLETYFKGILVGIDDVASAALFDGMDDLTISARCGMAMLKPDDSNALLRALGDKLNGVQKDHCYLAILGDRRRANAVLELTEPFVPLVQTVIGT